MAHDKRYQRLSLTHHPFNKLIVGWREYVALPAWGVNGVLAKIDTGARTSSLHVKNLVDLGNQRIRFDVVLSRTQPDRNITVETQYKRLANIRPSTGKEQLRYVIETKFRVGHFEKNIEISLASRKNMYCRMLIGRTALGEDFLVDASRKFIFGRIKRIKKRKKKA